LFYFFESFTNKKTKEKNMLEEIIEKLKEYKLFVGLAVVGAVLGGFFLIKGNQLLGIFLMKSL